MCEDALQITELVNLEILRLIQNGFINDDFLIALASKCKQLIYLDINGKLELLNIIIITYRYITIKYNISSNVLLISFSRLL